MLPSVILESFQASLQSFQSSKFKLTLLVILGLLGFLFYKPALHVPTLAAIIAALGGYHWADIAQKKNNKPTP